MRAVRRAAARTPAGPGGGGRGPGGGGGGGGGRRLGCGRFGGRRLGRRRVGGRRLGRRRVGGRRVRRAARQAVGQVRLERPGGVPAAVRLAGRLDPQVRVDVRVAGAGRRVLPDPPVGVVVAAPVTGRAAVAAGVDDLPLAGDAAAGQGRDDRPPEGRLVRRRVEVGDVRVEAVGVGHAR